MTADGQYVRFMQGTLAFVAAAFGLATVVAGARVLTGADPGYVVFWPLLIYNTAMGMAYVAAAVLTWRRLDRGRHAAGAIVVLNLLVLGVIGYLYAAGSAVAIDSVRAMTFRTVIWFVLFLGLTLMHRASPPGDLKSTRVRGAPANQGADETS